MASSSSRDFTAQFDVVVVGYGAAGAVAACAAADCGARVLIVEKMSVPGGISICSGGGARYATDAAAALAYLRRTNAETAPDAVLIQLAEGMVDLPHRFGALCSTVGAKMVLEPAPGNYPFDGYDHFGYASVGEMSAVDHDNPYPWVRGAVEGRRLFWMLEKNVQARVIEVWLDTAAQELHLEKQQGIVGLRVVRKNLTISVTASSGVVLACGGFEANPEMQKQFWQANPVYSAAFLGNTGDGIRMAQALGADIWHMWHFHGSYGFRHSDPSYPFGIRTKPLPEWCAGAQPPPDVRLPWILLDRSGRRFMNEYEPYQQDTGARPLARYMPDWQEYAALPAWMILDSRGHGLWPLGRATSNEPGVSFDWSADNEAEVELGILRKAASLDELSVGTMIPEPRLREVLGRWNAFCKGGKDDDWCRPPTSMIPISELPFTYAEVWPIVSNTQGGLVHDAEQRVLSVREKPIPGLFAAGEISSVFGHLYLSGGNISECFVGGRMAGISAARRREIERRPVGVYTASRAL